MKAAEIRAFDDARLQKELGELQSEWRTLRFQEAVGQLTATARIRRSSIRNTRSAISTRSSYRRATTR